PGVTDASAWGVHDRVPDYRAFSSPEDFTREDPYAQGGPSGCGWYRIVLPFDELARHGWKTGYAAGTPPRVADEYRLVVAQRMDKHGGLSPWRRMRMRHRLRLQDRAARVQGAESQLTG